MRIAIVDDLAAERTLLKDRLEQQLHRRNVQADILEYESGETFLEAARKAPFTAAFLDIYMDGMTGMEAARTLRKTDTDCLLVLPRPRPTMRWRAFRYGRCTIWSSPLPKRTSMR